MQIKTAIIGASGYTGAELLRILSLHPNFEVIQATADSQAGKMISELYPHLKHYSNLKLLKYEEIREEIKEAELLFCALPHGQAMKILPGLENKVIVDLGGDFRLKDSTLYTKWYKHEHTAAEAVKDWQYGLSEFFREDIKRATRISNPGCYPTAAILPLAPLYKAGLVEGVANIAAISGSSGAGRVPSEALHVSHVLEDVRAYKVTAHQHTPEIEAVISEYSGTKTSVTFTPHLVPMVRGINATCVCRTKAGAGFKQLFECLKETYRAEPFVSVTDRASGTKEVRASNHALISVFFDERTSQAILTCVIDNLVKGAAGQAVQNANLAFGIEETSGLKAEALYP